MTQVLSIFSGLWRMRLELRHVALRLRRKIRLETILDLIAMGHCDKIEFSGIRLMLYVHCPMCLKEHPMVFRCLALGKAQLAAYLPVPGNPSKRLVRQPSSGCQSLVGKVVLQLQL